MLITKKIVADKIAVYLHHDITLAQLVDWAEHAMMEDEFEESGLPRHPLGGFPPGRRRRARVRPYVGGLRGPAQSARFFRPREHHNGVSRNVRFKNKNAIAVNPCAEVDPVARAARVKDKVSAAEKLKTFMLSDPVRGVNIKALIDEGRA